MFALMGQTPPRRVQLTDTATNGVLVGELHGPADGPWLEEADRYLRHGFVDNPMDTVSAWARASSGVSDG